MAQIDILMAVYNGAKYIEEQIDSILHQTYSDLHLTIRDNASEDNTVQIIEEMIKNYPDKITLICSLENVGVIGNFAALMEQSQADYVMFSDCDDVWMYDKVEKTMAKFSELEKLYGRDKPLLVHSDLTVVNRNLETIDPSFWKFTHIKPSQGHALNRLLVQNVITGCTMMVNRALLDLALPIPENVMMHDWWLGLIASAFGAIEEVDRSTILYRQHGLNDTGAKKYGLIPAMQRHLNKSTREKISAVRPKRFTQAKELLERHSKLLSQNQKEMLEDFVSLEHSSFLTKRILMAKHKFFKHGFSRNLAAFLPLDVIKNRILS